MILLPSNLLTGTYGFVRLGATRIGKSDIEFIIIFFKQFSLYL